MQPEDLGPRLMKLRTDRGIGLRELSRMAEISPATLSAIENGQNSPTLATLHKLLKAISSDFATFFSTGENQADSPVFASSRMRTIEDEHRKYTFMFPQHGDMKFELVREVLSPSESEKESEWETHDHDIGCILLSGGPLRLQIESKGEWTVYEKDAFLIKEGLRHRAYVIGEKEAHLVTVIVPPRY